MSTCRSCGAEIIWVESATTHRNMPVDVEPSEQGNIRLKRRAPEIPPLAYVIGSTFDLAWLRQENVGLHTSHFVTCPQAPDWRSRRDRGGDE